MYAIQVISRGIDLIFWNRLGIDCLALIWVNNKVEYFASRCIGAKHKQTREALHGQIMGARVTTTYVTARNTLPQEILLDNDIYIGTTKLSILMHVDVGKFQGLT